MAVQGVAHLRAEGVARAQAGGRGSRADNRIP